MSKNKNAKPSKIIDEEDYVPSVSPKKTSKWMSQYEYAAFVTYRILSYVYGTEPDRELVKKYNYDTVQIAQAEVDAKIPRLVSRRTLPDGSVEDWLLQDLEFPFHSDF